MLDGRKVHGAVDAARVMLRRQPGDRLEFVVRRGGGERKFVVTLGAAEHEPAVVSRRDSASPEKHNELKGQSSGPAPTEPKQPSTKPSDALAELKDQLRERDERIRRLEQELAELKRSLAPPIAPAPVPAPR
jgi:hypothetical protein